MKNMLRIVKRFGLALVVLVVSGISIFIWGKYKGKFSKKK
jgi:hypothetical protein